MISEDISKKINSLASIGAEKQVSDTLRKIIVIRLKDYETKLSRLSSDLKIFEDKFDKKSHIFFNEFNKGKLGDDMDFLEWAGLYENYLLFKDRISLLRESL
jgi:Rad3-related DNA helicase